MLFLIVVVFGWWTARLTKRIGELEESNADLREQILEGQRTEEEARRFNDELQHDLQARTEALQAANEELAAFSYSVSHDLRAPLHAVLGFSQALAEDYGDQLDEPGSMMLSRIEAAGKRMSGMIDGILRLSRITNTNLRRATVDLSKVANEVAEKLRSEGRQREVDLEVQPGLTVEADLELVRILMRHLIGNAWKFTSGRQPAVIRLQSAESEGRNVFVLSDNGVGFDMAQSDRLFKPFQRLHRREDFSGDGIGLATAYRIVQRHGGTISIRSEPGQGAEVTFSL